ncbi:MAG TPA: J domain-containing protein, partial [Niastella sp.]
GGHHFSSEDFGGGDFSEFFESLFGGHGRSRGGRSAKFRGQDYESELKINLTDAYTTHKQTLTINGKSIRITIPAGIEDGQKIRLKGHGGEGVNGGPAGDLYITFSIINNTGFKRVGNDLYHTQDIDLYTALLGGEVTVDTLSGKVKLKVKPETQNGTKVRLKEKGFAVYKEEGKFGDLYVTMNVKLPTNLTEQQKELIKQLSEMK